MLARRIDLAPVGGLDRFGFLAPRLFGLTRAPAWADRALF